MTRPDWNRRLSDELDRIEATYPLLACPECGHDVDHTTACPGGCPLCHPASEEAP